MIPWLLPNSPFPPLADALREPNGLLAAGGDLSAERLLDAYRHGVFPWFSPGDPILWWSPDPRMVLAPAALKISRSLKKRLRAAVYEVRIDCAFADVVAACADTPRDGQHGTWITPEIREAYQAMHELGVAHSVESWRIDSDGEHLVGGLYGMSIGRMFYGESMFAHADDASKVALAHLCRHLQQHGCGVIDCQMETSHLASLGAQPIARDAFIARMQTLLAQAQIPWPRGPVHFDWASPASIDG